MTAVFVVNCFHAKFQVTVGQVFVAELAVAKLANELVHFHFGLSQKSVIKNESNFIFDSDVHQKLFMDLLRRQMSGRLKSADDTRFRFLPNHFGDVFPEMGDR